MKLGEIYQASWHATALKIIGFDDLEVFYDAYWEHDGSWTIASNLDKKCSFYRAPRNLFNDKAELVDFKGFSEEEQNILRPDLTIRTARIKNASWTDSSFSLPEIDFQMDLIKTEKIWLYPYGPKGGTKRGKIVSAENGECFGTTELISKAQDIQLNVNSNPSMGIGIYRMGIERQIPSYYIGEYIDFAGIMKSEN